MLKYFLVKIASEDGLVKRQRNQRSNCQHPLDHWKSESSRETSTSALLTMLKPLTVWITTKCEKFFKRWEYQTTWPASWEICRQVKKQQLELDMEQQTGSKSGKEYIKAVYCHPSNFYAEYIMRNVRLNEAQAGIKIDGRNINNLRCANYTIPIVESEEELKSPLDESEKWKWSRSVVSDS